MEYHNMTLDAFTKQLVEFISTADYVLDCDDLAKLIPEQFMDIDQLTEIIAALNANGCKIDASTDCLWGELNGGDDFYAGNLIFKLFMAETLRTTSPWENLYSKLDKMSSGSIEGDKATIQRFEEIRATLQAEIFRFDLGRDFINQRLLGWLSGEVPLSSIFCGPSLDSQASRDSAGEDEIRDQASIERTPDSPEKNVSSRIEELVRFIKKIDSGPQNSAKKTSSAYDEFATFPFKENLTFQALLQAAEIVSSALKPLVREADRFLEVCTNELGLSELEARTIVEARGFYSYVIDLQESSSPLDQFRKSEIRRPLELCGEKIRFLERKLGISGHKAYCSAKKMDGLFRDICAIRKDLCQRALAAAKDIAYYGTPIDFRPMYVFQAGFDDRFQAAMLVAITAIDSYSGHPDLKFSEYVEHLSLPFIKLEDIASISSMVISLDLFQELSNFSHMENIAIKNLIRFPTQAEVEQIFFEWEPTQPLNHDELQIFRDKFTLCNFNDDVVPQGYFDESASLDEPYFRTEAEQMSGALNKAIAYLSEREKAILKHRLGLDGNEALTLEAVGALHGLTRERIRQIEAKALRRLRGIALRRERCPELADFR